jgi:hypothetical protein
MSGDLATHAHRFVNERRVDHCHFLLYVSTCACGATDEVEHERDFENFPMSVAFAREDCARCREILRDREPASWGRGEPDAE